MGYFLPENAEVIVFIGIHATVAHKQKLQSFRTSFRSFCPKGKIGAVVEAHDDAAEAYQKSRKVLDGHPAVNGIYVATANSMPVIRAMEQLRRTHKIKVITAELFPGVVPHMRS